MHLECDSESIYHCSDIIHISGFCKCYKFGLGDRVLHSAVITSWIVITGLGMLVQRKRPLLSHPQSLFTKKSIIIDQFNSFVVYTFLYLLKTLHLINEINHSHVFSAFLPAHTDTSLVSSLQTVIMNSSQCLQPSVLLAPTRRANFAHLHTIFMLCLRMRIHGLVI